MSASVHWFIFARLHQSIGSFTFRACWISWPRFQKTESLAMMKTLVDQLRTKIEKEYRVTLTEQMNTFLNELLAGTRKGNEHEVTAPACPASPSPAAPTVTSVPPASIPAPSSSPSVPTVASVPTVKSAPTVTSETPRKPAVKRSLASVLGL